MRVSKSVWRGTNAIESWSWKDCDGNKAEVEVFADACQVELLLNGKSLGRKKIKDYKAFFKTKYSAGELTAISYDENGNKIAMNSMHSASEAGVCIVPEKEKYKAGDIAYININIQDKDGIVESNADRALKVFVEGGELLGFGSANPCTKEDFTKGEYTTYYGRSQAIVRKTSNDACIIKVSSANEEQVKEI